MIFKTNSFPQSAEISRKWLAMRLIALFMFVFSVSGSATVFSQKISISEKDVPLEKVFTQIKQQSSYVFFYDEEWMKQANKVTLNVENASLETVLKICFLKQPLTYSIVGNTIVLKKVNIIDTPPMLLDVQVFAPIVINGEVTAADGKTLVGATIKLKGSNNIVKTDANGNYEISINDTKGTLVFSYVGYEDQEIQINDLKVINVIMKESVNNLNQIVLIGYGTARRRDLTGSVATVKQKDMSRMALNDAAKAIMGKVAGVLVSESNLPGGGSSLLIRGKRSITASNNPLLVVDGVPIAGADLSDFPVSDIESMEVLKDASATAVYGSRAANGVVLITTKRGDYNSPGKFEYNSSVAFQTAGNLQPYMNPAQYLQRNRWYNWSQGLYADPLNPTLAADKTMRPYSNGSVGVVPFDPYTRSFIDAAWAGGIYDANKLEGTNWQDILFRQGLVTDHQLSFTGGEKNIRTFIAGGYYGNRGFGIFDEYKRYSLRANIDYAVKNWLTITFSSSNVLSENPSKGYGNSTFGARNNVSFNLIPISKPYLEDGSINMLPGNDSGIGSFLNPLLNQNGRTREANSSRFLETLTTNIKLGSGFSYKLQASYDGSFANDGEFNGQYSSWGLGNKTSLGIGVNRADYSVTSSASYLMENILNYKPELGPKHSLSATVLNSFQTFTDKGLYAGGDNNEIPYQKWYNMAGYPDNRRVSSALNNSSLESYLGRFNYSYLNRYILTGSLRIDGSSVFSTGNKYDYFPSFAFAWKLNEENFIKDIEFINQLKLRVGYGVTGNSAVSPGQTLGSLRKTAYLFQQTLGGIETPLFGYAPRSLNTTLRWEKTGQSNIGLDFELFKGILSGTIDVYSSKTTDLIMPRKLPVAAAGLEDIIQNIGQTSNKGIELLLSSINIKQKDFKWTTDFTFSYNKEAIDKIYKEGDDIDNGWFIGQPLNVLYFYDYMKILDPLVNPDDQATIDKKNKAEGILKYKNGDVLVRDLNGDDKITASDRMILGQIRPKFIGAITNTFSYKGLDLTFMFYGKIGNIIGMNYGTLNSDRDNAPVINYWTPGNASATYPRLRVGQPFETNSIVFVDGSYLRLRNVNLNYNFPAKMISKLRLSKLSAYIAVQNPNLILKNKRFIGTDPEYASGIGDLPQPTSTILGLSIGF